MVPLRFIPTGNYSTGDFSTPLRSARNDRTAWCHCVSAWCHCVSYRQETFHKWFPIRHGSIAFHTGRKLSAYSFLSDMVPLRFSSIGNYSQMVSYPAWFHCVSYRQETIRPEISRLRFAPLEMTERHGAIAFHTDRKLFANGFLSGMVPLRFISTGNYSRIVSYPTWCHCVSSQQETFCV